MGKATVLSGGEDGLYMVRVDYGAAERFARLDALDAEIAALTTEIAGLDITLQAFKSAEEVPAVSDVEAATVAYATAARAVPPDDAAVRAALAAHGAALKALVDVRMRYAQLENLIEERRAQKASAERSYIALASAIADEVRSAWCADLTVDASGEVATVEVPGENQTVLIAPGAPAPGAAYGELIARELMTGPQAFFNAAILPGWQRHMPTYRAGTAEAVDVNADTMDVTLDAATSSAQGLPVNSVSELSAVPVEYMTCNAAAFAAGDRVLVKFDGQTWEAPKVIGFAEHPKPCNTAYAVVDYMQAIEGTTSYYRWAITALIDVEKQTILQTWRRQIGGADAVVSINRQPWIEIGGYPESFSYLFESDGGGALSISTNAQSVQQSGGKLYGIYMNQADAFDPSNGRVLIEYELDPGILRGVGSWTPVNSNSSLNSLSASAGHVVAGGFVDMAYRALVFDAATRSLVASMVVPNVIESVDLTRDYLGILNWGVSSDAPFEVDIYSRNGNSYTLMRSRGLTEMGSAGALSLAIVNDRVILKDTGTLWIYKIDRELGDLFYEGSMTPFAADIAAIGGDYRSRMYGEPSGGQGHSVCAVART